MIKRNISKSQLQAILLAARTHQLSVNKQLEAQGLEPLDPFGIEFVDVLLVELEENMGNNSYISIQEKPE